MFDAAVRAVIDGDSATLRSLLGDRPDLIRARSTSEHGSTLLHYVSANGIEDELQRTPANAVEIAEILLEVGAEADALQGTYDGGWTSTPLALLCSSGHPHERGNHAELVEALIRGGAAVNGIDGDGCPLNTALSFRYPAVVAVLGRHGARPANVVDAAALGALDRLREMLDAGPEDPTQRFVDPFRHVAEGSQALELALGKACLCGQLGAASLLIERGVDVDAVTIQHGARPIHEAAHGGSVELTRLLLDHGADTTKRDTFWNGLPADWARARGHLELCDTLRNESE
ncbi:MAG: hypothetical protein GY716_15190 [bacterium]|nr:hypothetical protein [bacterium]